MAFASLRFVLAVVAALISTAGWAEEALIPVRDLDPAAAAKVSYSRDIRPILESKCIGCHAGERPKGLYSVATFAELFKEGGSAGPGVIAGKPDESSIVTYIRGVDQPRMPKDEPPLSEDQVHLIRSWILAGALDDTGNAPEPETEEADPALDPLLARLGNDPALLAEYQKLLFVADPVEQIVKKREFRIKLLPEPPTPPDVTAPVYNEVDRFIAAKWETDGSENLRDLVPDVCDDVTYLRRAYLDLIGRIPSVEEAERFLNDPSPRKRAGLVDELLARNEDYAAHWTPFWEDALCSNGNHQGGVGTHGNYREWVFNNFRDNKAFDVMVAELIDPNMPNNAEKYILYNNHTKTIQSAANTAQVFLGTSMKCASCHNHFENAEWTQTRFYGFAGFFSPNDLELVRCEEPTGVIQPTKFMFDLPGMPTDIPSDRRARLKRVAQLLVDPTNPRFSQSIVNRLWNRYFGLGLFEPVDDYREDRPASHPELLEWLAQDFMRNGYDIKHSIRRIMTSRTYQLVYNPEFEDSYDVAQPDAPRHFRSPSLRRMTAEQYLDSVSLAVGHSAWRGVARAYQDDESTPLTRTLGRPSTRNEVSTSRAEDVAVVQSLELLNGDELFQRVYTGPALKQLAEIDEPIQIADGLFRRVFNYSPAGEECAATLAFIEESLAATGPREASEEIIWIDDDIPSGASVEGTSGAASWAWIESASGPVFSGSRSHRQTASGPVVQHFVVGATASFDVRPGDVLYAYVYLDPANPPKEIMMQWHQGDWEHRAYWGEDAIPYGGGTPNPGHHFMGPLPSAGEWVRMEVPAAAVALEGPVDGWSFDQAGGTVTWDKAGRLRPGKNPKEEVVGDLAWALLVSPRFQYIH